MENLYSKILPLLYDSEVFAVTECDGATTVELKLLTGELFIQDYSSEPTLVKELEERLVDFILNARSTHSVPHGPSTITLSSGMDDSWSTTRAPEPSKLSASDVHKAVRNCVHNELKLTREDIVAMIEPRIDAEIRKTLTKYIQQKFEQGDLRKMFRAEIAEYMTKERHVGFTRLSFQDYIDRLVREEIRAMLMSRLDVKVEVKG